MLSSIINNDNSNDNSNGLISILIIIFAGPSAQWRVRSAPGLKAPEACWLPCAVFLPERIFPQNIPHLEYNLRIFLAQNISYLENNRRK